MLHFTPYFQAFWSDFADEMRLIRDFYGSVSRLLLYIHSAGKEEQNQLIQGLLKIGIAQDTGYKIAWAALKQSKLTIGNDEALLPEAESRLKQIKPGYDDAAILADILLLLCRNKNEQALPFVYQYLYEYPIGPYWTQVVWEVLPLKPEWFYDAWRRYFLSEPKENWQGTKLMALFLNHPEVINPLTEHIRIFSPKHADAFLEAVTEANAE